ncbi:expressed protein [Phakopsora pachyrhizi]|uniref:Expressed protein n=1 Tax=Phakopsora pachyrhizi TaxID=170000 RepID=A0AAV0AVV2_PHAPC|nr:expressed protein [Phakopsora pachyrhizi]
MRPHTLLQICFFVTGYAQLESFSTLLVPQVVPSPSIESLNDKLISLKKISKEVENIKAVDQSFPVTGLPGGAAASKDAPSVIGAQLKREYSNLQFPYFYTGDKYPRDSEKFGSEEYLFKDQKQELSWWRRLIHRLITLLWGYYGKNDKTSKVTLRQAEEWKKIATAFSETVVSDPRGSERFDSLGNGFTELSLAKDCPTDDPRCIKKGLSKTILIELVTALASENPTEHQTELILRAINHLTSYNKFLKEALFEATEHYPSVFKTLALAINRVRPNGLPSLKVKNSFEAEWLSTEKLLERYHRTIFIHTKLTNSSPLISDLTERLENIKNVFEWSTGNERNFPEVQQFMLDAMTLLYGWRHETDLSNNYLIIEYIANVNNEALHSLTEIFINSTEARHALMNALIHLYKKPLFDNIPENSLAYKVLMHPTLGPIMNRKYIETAIPLNKVAKEIANLKVDILSCKEEIQRLTPDPDDQTNARLLLKRVLDELAKVGPGYKYSSNVEINALKMMMGYLQRWNPFVKEKIQESLDQNRALFKSLSFVFHESYPDGIIQTAPKHTFEYQLLAGSAWGELFEREAVLSFKSGGSGHLGLDEAATRLKNLPKRWYTEPLYDTKVSKITKGLLEYLDCNNLSEEETQGEKVIKMLQHLTYYMPQQKDFIHIQLQNADKKILRSHLQRHYQKNSRKLKISLANNGITETFVSWLKEGEF